MATGEGYDLCKTVCHQTAHAEINALAAAVGHTQGATLYLEGHTYLCADCLGAVMAAGISEIYYEYQIK
jgi:deoxycytidylate deaminase